MNKNMVETMQNDMHLFPYRDESISNYLGRLVYSALSYWIRTCIMDRMSESNDTKSKALMTKDLLMCLVVQLRWKWVLILVH